MRPQWPRTKGEPTCEDTLEDGVDERYLKAAKADDAAVDKDLWAMPGETEEEAGARDQSGSSHTDGG